MRYKSCRRATERRGSRGPRAELRIKLTTNLHTLYLRSSAPFLSTYSSTYFRTFDRTLSVNAKSEDREACLATKALASFGPKRAMASLDTRPRSKCSPRKLATALFISRAKDATVGGGGARGC